VPRLESILRDIARGSGIAIVKPVRDGRFGGVQSLTYIMTKLRALNPDAAWFDYLDALLCDALAIDLRNDITDGIVRRVGGVSAALLIQGRATCHSCRAPDA
jgi:hypothetical protein